MPVRSQYIQRRGRRAKGTRCASSSKAFKGVGNRLRRLVALLVGCPILANGCKISRRRFALVATRRHESLPGRAFLSSEFWIWGHVGGASACALASTHACDRQTAGAPCSIQTGQSIISATSIHISPAQLDTPLPQHLDANHLMCSAPSSHVGIYP